MVVEVYLVKKIARSSHGKIKYNRKSNMQKEKYTRKVKGEHLTK